LSDDFERIMLEVCDLLENGDAALDFVERGQAHEATVIRIIACIVRNELDSIRFMRELRKGFPFTPSKEDDDVGATK